MIQGHLSRPGELTSLGCQAEHSTVQLIKAQPNCKCQRHGQHLQMVLEALEPSGSRCFWNTSCCWTVVSRQGHHALDCCPWSPAAAAASWLDTMTTGHRDSLNMDRPKAAPSPPPPASTSASPGCAISEAEQCSVNSPSPEKVVSHQISRTVTNWSFGGVGIHRHPPSCNC